MPIASDDDEAEPVDVEPDEVRPWAIGTSASSPEGLSGWDVLEAMFLCGQHPKVAALDVVEIDPTRDVRDLTARSGCSIILTFLAGLQRRLNGDMGY